MIPAVTPVLAILVAAAASFLGFAEAAIPDTGFEPWFEERGVAVEIRRSEGDTPWIRAASEVPASAEAVYTVLTDYRAYRKFFDPGVSRADVLETEESAARIHLVWPYPFPFRRRDAIVVYRGQPAGDGFRVVWRDAARAGDPSEGVRIQRVAGETRIAPRGASACFVTYTYLGDLGGRFPKALEEKAWRHEPLGYFHALRRRLGLPISPE